MTNPKYCQTKADINALWPYTKSKCSIKQYPKFPCFAEFISIDCGIMGDAFTLTYVCPPKDSVDIESFRKGLIASEKVNCLGKY